MSKRTKSRTKSVAPSRATPPSNASLQRQLGGKTGQQIGGPALPAVVHDVLRTAGEPLDEKARALMEPGRGHDFGRVSVKSDVSTTMQRATEVSQPSDRLEVEADRISEAIVRDEAGTHATGSLNYSQQPGGHDFGKVRIHTDSRAAEAAESVSARAYTVGNDIVFGAGQYQPETLEGRRLIAHELAHVEQQSRGTQVDQPLQRAPVFPDESCNEGKKKDKIINYQQMALEVVQKASVALADPASVAGPLKTWFHIDVDNAEHAGDIASVQSAVAQLQAYLEGPVPSFCDRDTSARAYASISQEGEPILELGITYKSSSLGLLGPIQMQMVNTVIHEAAHLIDLGHGEEEGEMISNKHSTKVRGWSKGEAMNHAEVLMRFIRAVT